MKPVGNINVFTLIIGVLLCVVGIVLAHVKPAAPRPECVQSAAR